MSRPRQFPPSLKRLWVWEAGADVPVDSSPAIVGGVVYVGTAAGELVALGLSDGALRWRYKAGESIGESSPAVTAGRVFIGDLDGAVHAVNAADGKAAWTYKTKSEIKSSPSVVGDLVLIGSYDGLALRARPGRRQAAMDRQDRKLRARHARDRRRHRVFRRVRRDLPRCACRDGSKVFEASATAYTGASVAMVDGVGYFGTFDNQVIAFDVKTRKVKWRYEHPERKFPFYSSAAISCRRRRARRSRSHGACARRGDGEGALDLHDPRAHRLVAGRRGRPRLRRLERRPPLRRSTSQSGKVVWEYEDGGALMSSPAIASGRVVFGSSDGRVVCLGIKIRRCGPQPTARSTVYGLRSTVKRAT